MSDSPLTGEPEQPTLSLPPSDPRSNRIADLRTKLKLGSYGVRSQVLAEKLLRLSFQIASGSSPHDEVRTSGGGKSMRVVAESG